MDAFCNWLKAVPGLTLYLAASLAICMSGCSSTSISSGQSAGSVEATEQAAADQNADLLMQHLPGEQGDAGGMFPADTMTLLQAELEKQLGQDPLRAPSTAAAPGAGNAVFDLELEVVSVGQEQDQLELHWSEVLQGDYDGNGEVGISDLVPLAKYLGGWINYRDPQEATGTAWWPQGEVTDTDLLNWKLARIDGNRDGLLSVEDVTPIAQHWGERIDGYRIYRSRNGSGPELLYWPGLPAAPLTIPRMLGVRVSGGNRHYSFRDKMTNYGSQTYEVRPYSVAAGLEGPASKQVSSLRLSELKADLQADFTEGASPLRVIFDASQSTVQGTAITWYRWDFDGDGVDDEQGILPTTAHEFGSGGGFSCRLTVVDATGREAQATREIRVDNPPLAMLELQQDEATAGDFVSYRSHVIAGDAPIADIRLEKSGPEENVLQISSQDQIGKSLVALPGEYTFRLTATDERGYRSRSVQTLVVHPKFLPRARIETDDSELMPGTQFKLDGSLSSSENGGIASFTWLAPGADFHTPEDRETVLISYPVGGLKIVTLVVTDQKGYVDHKDMQLDLVELPVAILESPALLVSGGRTALDARGSYPLHGGKLRYDWDLDGAGEFEILDAGDRQWLTVPQERGYITVRLRVSDELGLSNIVSRQIYIYARPVARYVLREQEGPLGREIELDASSSEIESFSMFRWDFQNGGHIYTAEPVIRLDPFKWPGSQYFRLTVFTNNHSDKVYGELFADWQKFESGIPLYWNTRDHGDDPNQLSVCAKHGDANYLLMPALWPDNSNGSYCVSRVIATDSGLKVDRIREFMFIFNPLGAAVINDQLHILYHDRSGHAVYWRHSEDLELRDWSEPVLLTEAPNWLDTAGIMLADEHRIIHLYASEAAGGILQRMLRPKESMDWTETTLILEAPKGFSTQFLEGAFIGGVPAICCSSQSTQEDYLNLYATATDESGQSWNALLDMQVPGRPQVRAMLDLGGRPAVFMHDRTISGPLFLARANDSMGRDWSDITVLESTYRLPTSTEMDARVVNGRPAITYWNNCHSMFIASDPLGLSWQPEVHFHDSFPTLPSGTSIVMDIKGYPACVVYGGVEDGYTNFLAEIVYPAEAPWAQ